VLFLLKKTDATIDYQYDKSKNVDFIKTFGHLCVYINNKD